MLLGWDHQGVNRRRKPCVRRAFAPHFWNPVEHSAVSTTLSMENAVFDIPGGAPKSCFFSCSTQNVRSKQLVCARLWSHGMWVASKFCSFLCALLGRDRMGAGSSQVFVELCFVSCSLAVPRFLFGFSVTFALLCIRTSRFAQLWCFCASF